MRVKYEFFINDYQRDSDIVDIIEKDIDVYLTKLYGDYMKLPTIEQRVQTHSVHKYMWR